MRIRRLILFLLPVILLGAAIALFEIRFNPTSFLYYTVAWVAVVLVLLWTGNRLITKLFNRYLSWLSYGNIRFFLHLVTGIAYSLVVINATYWALKYLLTIDPPTQNQVIVMNVYGAILFIPAFSVYFSLHFLSSWKKSELESEKFQKASARSQLELLKSHLDPHFLFNNLNILASLIDKDKEQSKEFLNKFAEMYRLLLRSKTEDLITLRQELEFIDLYCFLIKTRFDESIQFHRNIPQAMYNFLLPPLTLQMLIENAIKHTMITEKRPLHVTLTTGENSLTVSNSLNERVREDDSKGSGLENIRQRYRYFSTQPVHIEKTQESFSVTIPLLETAIV